jgi:ribonuclease HI
MEKVYIYTDGGSRGNPGPAGAGIFICDHEKNMLKEVAKYLGVGTNNMAEYQAVVIALKTLKKMYGTKTHTSHFEVRMDSELTTYGRVQGERSCTCSTLCIN